SKFNSLASGLLSGYHRSMVYRPTFYLPMFYRSLFYRPIVKLVAQGSLSLNLLSLFQQGAAKWQGWIVTTIPIPRPVGCAMRVTRSTAINACPLAIAIIGVSAARIAFAVKLS